MTRNNICSSLINQFKKVVARWHQKRAEKKKLTYDTPWKLISTQIILLYLYFKRPCQSYVAPLNQLECNAISHWFIHTILANQNSCNKIQINVLRFGKSKKTTGKFDFYGLTRAKPICHSKASVSFSLTMSYLYVHKYPLNVLYNYHWFSRTNKNVEAGTCLKKQVAISSS